MKQRIVTIKFGEPCPHCGCTDRTPYHAVRRVRVGSPNAKRVVIYVTRRTSCKRCGKIRVETRLESPK